MNFAGEFKGVFSEAAAAARKAASLNGNGHPPSVDEQAEDPLLDMTDEEICELPPVEFDGARDENDAGDFNRESIFNAGDEITNAIVVKAENEKTVTPVPIEEIRGRAIKATDDWPRSAGGFLFVHTAEGRIDNIDKPAALMAFIGDVTGKPPRFINTPGCHTKDEFFQHWKRKCTRYAAVETLPHEPLMQDHYYAITPPAPGNGDCLRQLVERFNPATDIDRDLIMAAFATPFWGGKGGSRPLMTVISRDGRGSGKTTLVEMIGRVAGGNLAFGPNEDEKTIKGRLLSPEAMYLRVALLDNLKSRRFSSGTLESFITADTISGHRLYVGEGRRPNTLTWFLTLNGASYSTDLAQRAVFIDLVRPTHTGGWTDATAEFIDTNRAQIIADIISFLRGPRFELKRYSRWGAWERDVLCRLPEPGEAQKVIAERQGAADIEKEEGDVVQDYFSRQLAGLQYNVDADRVFIPSVLNCKWLGLALNEKFTTTAASRMMMQMVEEGQIARLEKTHHPARGFLWVGENWNPGDEPKTDIESRIDINANREWR